MSFYKKFVLIVVLDVVSALTARQAYNAESVVFLILSIASITLAGWLFIKLLNERVTIVVNAVWIALGAINVTLASYLVFGETLTWLQAVGMATIVAGLITIELTNSSEEEEIHTSKT